MITLHLCVDKEQKYIRKVIHGRAGEEQLTTIEVNFLQADGTTPFDLTGYAVHFKAVNAKGGYTTGTAKIMNSLAGQVQYTFSSNNFSVAGEFKVAFFELKNAVGNITSQAFGVKVEPTADISSGQAGLYISELETLLGKFTTEWDTFLTNKNQSYSELANKLAQLTNQANTMGSQIAAIEKKIADNDVYTKREVQDMLQKIISGQELEFTFTLDMAEKVAGSTTANLNVLAAGSQTTLQVPNSTSLNEVVQTRYDQVSALDGTLFSVAQLNSGHYTQLCFKWNVLEAFNRRFVGLFEALGITDTASQVSLMNNLIVLKSMSSKVYGYGSAPNSTTLYSAMWNSSSSQWSPIRNVSGTTVNTIAQNSLTHTAYMTSDGCIYVNAYAEASNGTTASAINIDYASLTYTVKLSLKTLFSTKQEVQDMLLKILSGQELEYTFTMDMAGKLVGDLTGNPSSATGGYGSNALMTPTAASEVNQYTYNGISVLDSSNYVGSTSTNGNMMQTIFRWNILEDFNRRFPGLFEAVGATDAASQITLFKSLIQSTQSNVHGYGSSPTGNKLSSAIFRQSDSNWVGTQSTTSGAIAKVTISTTVANVGNYILSDGTVAINAYADVSNGTTASTVNMDYASLEYTVKLSMKTLFAAHKDVEDAKFSVLAGDAVKKKLTLDLSGKVAASTTANPHFMGRATGTILQVPTANWTENNQDMYNRVFALDNSLFTATESISGNMRQMIFKWDVLAAIQRAYPNLFTMLGANTTAEKVAIAKTLLKRIAPSVWGYGSGAGSTKLIMAMYFNSTWTSSTTSHSNSSVQQLRLLAESTGAIGASLNSDGYVYVLVYAAASDGTTASTVSVDYASLELELELSMSQLLKTLTTRLTALENK